MFDFTDKVVVVTGAAGNLGGAASHAFADAGARTGLLDHRMGRLQEVCGPLDGDPRHVLLGNVDMMDPDSVADGVGTVLDTHKRIDILVNAIGGYRAGTPVHETPLETWDFMFGLNARSAFLASRVVVPTMLEQKGGVIINVAARPGLRGAAEAAAYSGSKAAVIRLTESLSAEVKHDGIRVNCILPGTLDTPENREQTPEADHARWVSPQTVADVILFLASNSARGVHGSAIPVYGTG